MTEDAKAEAERDSLRSLVSDLRIDLDEELQDGGDWSHYLVRIDAALKGTPGSNQV
jgi:hypothetical protein